MHTAKHHTNNKVGFVLDKINAITNKCGSSDGPKHQIATDNGCMQYIDDSNLHKNMIEEFW